MQKRVKSVDGTSIFYRIKKTKNPLTLVFLHGIGGNWTTWKKEIEFFEKIGYSTLTMDLRGHGKSGIPSEDSAYSTDMFTKDLHIILKKEKIKDFILIGHSFGGGVSIVYCKLHREHLPRGLVLVETCYYYPYQTNRPLNMNPFVVKMARHIANHEDLRKKHFKNIEDFDYSVKPLIYLSAPIRVILDCLDSIQNYSTKHSKSIENTLKCLEIPVLLIAAKEDKIMPPKFVKAIRKELKNSQLKVFKKGDHFITIKDPEKINKELFKFIKSKF